MRRAAWLLGMTVLTCGAVATAQSPPPAAPSTDPAAPAQPSAAQPPPATQPGQAPPAGARPAPPPQYPQGYAPPPAGYGQQPPTYPYYYYPGYYQPPAQLAAPPVPKRRRSAPMMIGGILATLGGAASLIAGAALYGSSKDTADVYCDDGTGPYLCTTKDDVGRATAGVIMMVGGGVGLAVGIPLWVIGGKMVPIKDQPPDETPAPPKTARPEVLVGPGAAAMRWRF